MIWYGMIWYNISVIWWDVIWYEVRYNMIMRDRDDVRWYREREIYLSFSVFLSLYLSISISLSLSSTISLSISLSLSLSDFFSLTFSLWLSLYLSLSLCLLEWVGRGNARDLHTENSFGQYQTGARSSAISTRCVSTLTLVLSSIKFITIYIIFDTVYYSLAFYPTCIFFLYSSSLYLFSFLISFLFSFVTFSS